MSNKKLVTATEFEKKVEKALNFRCNNEISNQLFVESTIIEDLKKM